MSNAMYVATASQAAIGDERAQLASHDLKYESGSEELRWLFCAHAGLVGGETFMCSNLLNAASDAHKSKPEYARSTGQMSTNVFAMLSPSHGDGSMSSCFFQNGRSSRLSRGKSVKFARSPLSADPSSRVDFELNLFLRCGID